MPALAPHSIDMLQMVMRPSIESASMVAPRYSTRWPWPADVPVRPMTPRTMSLAVTPRGRTPVTSTARSPWRFWGRHWVASTSSTSDVPMPNASAPKPPAGHPEALEGLWRGDLVDEVEVDEEEVGLTLDGTDDVGVPKLLGECLCHRDRQLYAARWWEICAPGTTRTRVSIVNIHNLNGQDDRLARTPPWTAGPYWHPVGGTRELARTTR